MQARERRGLGDHGVGPQPGRLGPDSRLHGPREQQECYGGTQLARAVDDLEALGEPGRREVQVGRASCRERV